MKKPELNKNYLTISLYALFVIFTALLFGVAVFRLSDIVAFFARAIGAIKALPYGIVFALILYPFVTMASRLYSHLLERKRSHPRAVSILAMLTVYIGMLVVLAVIFIGVIPPMIDTVKELSALIGDSLAEGEAALRRALLSFNFPAEFGDKVIEYIKNATQNFVKADLAGLATSVLTGFVGETLDILVGLVISIYLLAGRRLIGIICGKIVTALLPSGGAQRISLFIKRLYSNFTEFIASRILSALFLGVFSYLIFRIFNIPFFALLSLIIMVMNLFPVFGTIFSLLLCGLVLLITKPVYTLPVLAILIGLEIVDNLLIEPHTMVHKPLRPNVGMTLVLLLIGYALFGFIGLLIAIPLFATLKSSFHSFIIHLLNRRGLPTALEEYHKLDVAALRREATEETAGTAGEPAEETASHGDESEEK